MTDKLGIVYRILCSASGKSYVGQTVRSIEDRWKDHVHEATREKCRGNRRRYPLHAAIRKYGIDAFSIEKLADCKDSELDAVEILWTEFFDCLVPNGYVLVAGHGRGRCSDETKKKMSAAVRKRWADPTSRAKFKESLTGRKFSEESKLKISEALTGKVVRKETREKISQALKGNKNARKRSS